LLVGAAASVAGGVAGCAASSPSQQALPSTSDRLAGRIPPLSLSTADDDRQLALDVVADEQGLLAAYVRLARDNPPLRARIRPLVDGERRHVRVLADALALERRPAAGRVIAIAGPASVVLHQIASGAARRRLRDCASASSGAVASVLASMAAAHSVAAGAWKLDR
jgi:hypothetical protein